MKKYMYAILVLAAAGAIISVLLLVQHFFPGSDIASATCGDGIDNPCHDLSLTGYAAIRGFPLASLGLFLYLFILFTILVADYAGEIYYDTALLMILPLSGAALVFDAVLAAILVKTGLFCQLCVASYAVNILMFALSLMWLKKILREKGSSLISFAGSTCRGHTKTAAGRASLALFTLFVLFLFLSILATSQNMEKKTDRKKLSRTQIKEYVSSFYGNEVEQLNLSESALVMGNQQAPLSIIVFTDFLCSACNNFFITEKYLLARFPEKINVQYYNFPLDLACNNTIKRTVYENSCLAAKAVNAAAKIGILNEYIKIHFKRYQEIKHGYSEETALNIFKEALPFTGKKIPERDFAAAMSSDFVDTTIRNDIELAREYDIKATPTLFIGGRRIRGTPPKEILEQIIKTELKKIRQ
ncbi:MAG TPA: thioredoxin domain-containing protein [Spirochaetota bacterium]|nr:thioredoxin domain-containing protein [Spirochaetota bacterium]HPI89657.1 thioredoxin domain-containing protein [Spirochaetota bacterium]HPR49757.1 thioredoxin domain-containing protein [Spirochaetota bacterium]